MTEYYISNDLEQYRSDFYLLRTPLLSIPQAMDFLDKLKGLSGGEIKELMQFLSTLYDNNLMLESIYIASPDLHAQYLRYKAGEIHKTRSLNKLAEALIQYYLRSCSRPTPFGLFAGCSLGGFGDVFKIDMGDAKAIRRSVRLDTDTLWLIVKELMRRPAIFTKIRYTLNSSVYKVGRSYRYIEFVLNEFKRRSHRIVSCESNPVLDKLCSLAVHGAYYAELVSAIVNMGYDDDNAAAYLEELIGSQLLISEININVTGEDCFTRIQALLETREIEDKAIITQLQKIGEVLTIIEDTNDRIGAYRRLFGLLHDINPDVGEKNCIQVDMYRDAEENVLPEAVLHKILSGTSVLRALNPLAVNSMTFYKFRRAFKERYENQMVSLAKVLDTEIGIGYREALSSTDADGQTGNSELSPFFDLKLTKYIRWLQEDMQGVIMIDDEDLKKIRPNEMSMADSINSLARITSEGGKPVYIIRTASGPSGGNLIARFSTTKHLDIACKLQKLYDKEEIHGPDAIYAEIAHLPESRMGNVLARPHLRDYEIPYLSYSTMDALHQISIDDLYLFCREERLILFSKKLNKEVIPRLSSAHNYRSGIPVYNFLADMQFQDIQSGCGWNWEYLSGKMRLPRVQYKDVILFPATWKFHMHTLKQTFLIDTPEKFEKQFGMLREKLRLPRFVQLVEFDNELLLDLDNPLFVHMIKKKIATGGPVELVEYLDSDMQAMPIVNSSLGAMSSEVNFAFYKKTFTLAQAAVRRNPSDRKGDGRLQRVFIPGSEWMYMKLYIAPDSADRLLVHHIYPIVNKLKETGLIKGWFFIRYMDPQFHIRLRLQLQDLRHYGEVLGLINKSIRKPLQDGVIWKSSIETYKREVERYGMKTMLLSEKVFDIDSDWVSLILRREERFPLTGSRFIAGVLMGMLILDAFDYNDEDKEGFFERNFNGFGQEFGIAKNQGMRNSLSSQFRQYSETFLNIYRGPATWMRSVTYGKTLQPGIFRDYYVCLQGIAVEVRAALGQEFSISLLNSLLPSYIHMSINRLTNGNSRETELRTYSFLRRSLASAMARV